MSNFHRYALAEALLAGNVSARWVLVDLLSELGAFDEAHFVRWSRTTREGNLDVAIRQLPCPEVVELGCEFVERLADRELAGLHSLLGRVRRLLRRNGSIEQFAAAQKSLAKYRSREPAWYETPLSALDEAVQSFAAAVEAAAPGSDQPPYAAHSPSAAAIAVTATARLLRDAMLSQYRVKMKPRELEWQIKRTRQYLGQLAGERSIGERSSGERGT